MQISSNKSSLALCEYYEVLYHSSGFIAVCPEGVMNRENILDMYAMPRHRAKLFANQIFKLFDKEGTGIINFRVKKYYYKMESRTSNSEYFSAIRVGH